MPLDRIYTVPVDSTEVKQGDLYTVDITNLEAIAELGKPVCKLCARRLGNRYYPANGNAGGTFTETASQKTHAWFEYGGGFTHYMLLVRLRTKFSGSTEGNIRIDLTANGTTQSLAQYYHSAGTGLQINTGTTGDYWDLRTGALSAQIKTFPGVQTEWAKFSVDFVKSSPGSVSGAGNQYFDGLYSAALYLYKDC